MSTQPLGVGSRIDAQNPWPGLSAFDEAAQRFFHGRDDESAELLRLVGQAPLTVLFSKSGLGKTSLLQAGLFPRLRQQNILPVYVRLDVRDRSAPLLQQAAAALQAETNKQGVDATAPNTDESLWEHLHGRDVQWWSPKNQPLTPLFVFDQFEEVFTLGAENTDAIERLRLDLADLIENRLPLDLAQRIEKGDLAEQLDLRGQRYKVLLSFREDFLPEVEGWKGELPSLMRNRLRLLPMNADRAVQVVSGNTPTGRTHELVNDDTAREIVRFVAAAQTGDEKSGRGKNSPKAADLPWEKLEIEPALLSLVCEGLNEKRKTRAQATSFLDGSRPPHRGLNEKRKTRAQATIDTALLKETGNAIIGDFYQRCVVDVPDQTRRFIEDSLITEGGFRNSYPLQDALDQGALTEPLLRQLVDRRLLRIDHQLGADRVELIHDRLTGVVREHRNEKRERLRIQQQRNKNLLLGTGVGFLVVVALVLIISLLNTRTALQTAREKTQVATAALQTARDQTRVAVASEWLVKDPTLAALVLLKVEHPDHTPYAPIKMAEVLHEPLSFARYKHPGDVRSAAFSPDGTRIVTASEDGTARVWRADGVGEPVVLKGHTDGVWSAAFSPDGTRIVTASADRTARVWSADGAGEPIVLKGHENSVTSAAFSPDGTRIVTASADRTARVWRVDGEGKPEDEPIVLKGHKEQVNYAAFNPDGTRVLTVSRDESTVRVWPANGTGKSVVFRVSPRKGASRGWQTDRKGKSVVYTVYMDAMLGDFASSATFSPDGTRVAATSFFAVHIWRADGTGKPIMLTGDKLLTESVAFSPDGTRVVTASDDGTVQVWRVDGEDEPIVLKGHKEQVNYAAFNPDGTRVVTASDDGTARVWRVDGEGKPEDEPIVLKGHEGPVSHADFSLDGAQIVTTSFDKTARVWRVKGTSEIETIRTSYEYYKRNETDAKSFSGKHLQTVIRSATSLCLDPPFRTRYFGDSPEEALRTYQTCERAHGRSGAYPP